ncbi:MAG: hypothetical protein AB1758_05515 [Candidatus Eremiobacterota bacterium]
MLLCLTLLLFVGSAVALWFGLRIPLGSAGLSMVTDQRGKPYFVLDRPNAQGVMVGVDVQPPQVEVYTGSIRF